MKTLKSTIILSIVFLLSAAVNAQTYTYKKKFDNPDNVRNLNMGVFGGIDFGLPDGVVGLQAHYMNKVFSVQGKIELGISGRNATLGSDSFAARGISPKSLIEVVGDIHLMDKVKKGTYKYILSSTTTTYGNYQHTTSKYLPVPVYYRRIVGLRGGLMNVNTFGVTSVFSNGSFDHHNYYKISNVNIFGGLMMKKVKFFKVGVEGFDRAKGIQQIREFFLDFMYSPGQIVNNGRVSGSDREPMAFRNIGFRMGWQWLSCRPAGGNFRLEFGLLPGYIIPESNLYTLMTFGLNVSARMAKKRPDIFEN